MNAKFLLIIFLAGVLTGAYIQGTGMMDIVGILGL